MKKQKRTTPTIKSQDETHDSLPASVGLVKELHEALRAEIRSMDHRMSASDQRILSIDHKIGTMDQKIGAMDNKIGTMDNKISAIDHKIGVMDQKINSLDLTVVSLRSDLRVVEHGLNAKIEQVIVSVHRTQALMEEQRGENRIVLDGLKNVFQRQDRMEAEFGELRDTVKVLATGVKR